MASDSIKQRISRAIKRLTGRDQSLEWASEAKSQSSSDVLVCVDASLKTNFSDNVFDDCVRCGKRVQYRPGNLGRGRPHCFDCALAAMDEAEASGDVTRHVVTREDAAEVAAALNLEDKRGLH